MLKHNIAVDKNTIFTKINNLNMSILEFDEKDDRETGKGFYDTLKNYANETANDKPVNKKTEKQKAPEKTAKDE